MTPFIPMKVNFFVVLCIADTAKPSPIVHYRIFSENGVIIMNFFDLSKFFFLKIDLSNANHIKTGLTQKVVGILRMP